MQVFDHDVHGYVLRSYMYISGKLTHATVGRIALVMSLAAASGGLTSTIIAGLVQVIVVASLYV